MLLQGLLHPKNLVGWTVCLELIYTNTHSMSNNQEELKVIVQQESSDRETWWDDWHTRTDAIGGHRLFRRFRKGRGGGGVALCDWELGLSGAS